MRGLGTEISRLMGRRATGAVVACMALVGVAYCATVWAFDLQDGSTLIDVWNQMQQYTIPMATCFFALLLAATLIGAENASHSMMTLLTFQPRRGVVYITKLLACGFGAVLIMLVGQIVFLGGAVGVVALRGKPVIIPTSHWLDQFLPYLGWGALASFGVGILVGSLGFLCRYTVGVVAAGMGYWVIAELLVGVQVPQVGRWLLGNNLFALIGGGGEYVVFPCAGSGQATSTCTPVTQVLSRADASIFLGAVLFVAFIIGWISFRRRRIG